MITRAVPMPSLRVLDMKQRTMDDTPTNKRPLHVIPSHPRAQDTAAVIADGEATLRSAGLIGRAPGNSSLLPGLGLEQKIQCVSEKARPSWHPLATDTTSVSEKNAAVAATQQLSAAVDAVKISEPTHKIQDQQQESHEEQDTPTVITTSSLLDIMKRHRESSVSNSGGGANSASSATRIRKRAGIRSGGSRSSESLVSNLDNINSTRSGHTEKQQMLLTPRLQSEQQQQQTSGGDGIFSSASAMAGSSSSIGNMLQQACSALEGYRGRSRNRRETKSSVKTTAIPSAASKTNRRPPARRFTAPPTVALAGRKSSTGSGTSSTYSTGTPKGNKSKRSSQGHRLSLSEYRKADEPTTRLTDANPNRTIHTDYDLHDSPHCRILGHGASSTVHLAVRRRDNALVAVKSLSKYEILFSRRGAPRVSSHRHRRLDEAEVLKSLGDVPNVAALLDVFEDEDEVQLVMEYCPGGELFDAIHSKRQGRKKRTASLAASNTSSTGRGSGYNENQVAVIVSQLLEALAALHDRGIVHRDVKPENCLLMSKEEGETRVKLSDFGLARYLSRHHGASDLSSDADDSSTSSASGGDSPITPQSVLRARAYSSVGSNYYAAPEVEMGGGYDTQCDVYSLGVTLYILLCGFPPSHRKAGLDAYDISMQALVESSSSGESSDEDEGADTNIPVTFPGTHWKTVSAGAKDLVRRMMHSDPSVRITAKDALKHEWIVHNLNKTPSTEKEREEEPDTQHRAPTKKRSSLVLTSDIEPNEADSRNFRRKVSGMSDSSSPADTMAAPIASAAVPPPLSIGSAAFSMAELYNRVSIVAEAATAAAAEQDDEDVDETMNGAAASATTTASTFPLSV